jgi:hypothetical protein
VDQIEVRQNIEELKMKLDSLIDEGADFAEIYDISVKLDKLIVAYYRSNSGKIN